MTAFTGGRKIERRGPIMNYSFGIKASAVILQGALVQLIAGLAIDAKTGADSTEAGTLETVGVAYDAGATGSAADGGVLIEVQGGEFKFKNSASGDLIAIADIGNVCYAVDNQTVAKTSATNTRAVAGRITGVDSDGVWVRVGPGLAA